ncbi:ribonuclease H-like domain-containing protein [Tanacetum coccineum]
MSSEEAKKYSINSDSNDDDDETHVTGSMVESSKTKKLKKFDFITEDGTHIHLTKEEINHQKKLKEGAKAEAAKQEREIRKEELVDLFGPEAVNKYYNEKLQYDRYCDKMLNRRAKSIITNYDILTIKGLITLKVYREDGTSEIIPEFKASDLHLAKLGINLDRPLSEQDPFDRLNDPANKKRKNADDIHNFFRANKRLKSSVQYKDHPAGTVFNEPVLELHQLHLDEEALSEILEEEARDEKEQEEKIRQKQADDEKFMLEFGVKYDSEYEIILGPAGIVQAANLNNENDQWELSLDIDDSDLRLTPVIHSSSSTRVETSHSTQNPVRIIPGPAGIVQAANLLKQRDILLGLDEAVMSTQEYIKKVVEDVGEDEDFKSGSRKLDQVVAIVKSCSPNVIGDLRVTMKDLSGTIPETIHHKVIGEGGYGNDITVGAVLILANVSVFSPKPSMHYLNITKRNVVKVFRKDTVLGSDSG